MKNTNLFPFANRVIFGAAISLVLNGCASLIRNPSGKVPIGSGYILPKKEFDKQMELAKSNDGEACYKLHLHYALGLHMKPDGLNWERKSAVYGYPLGMYSYGVALWSIAETRSQRAEAKRWIAKAAVAGDTYAKAFFNKEQATD